MAARIFGVIWSLGLDEPVPVIQPLVQAVFRRAGPEDASVLAEAVGRQAGADLLRRFETGRRCYTAWVGGNLAAYGWVSFEKEFVGELRLNLRLPPCEAYIWDCATLPAFRQKLMYSALLVYILRELRAERVCRAWIGADQENVASQRGMARAGFQHVADLMVSGGPGQLLGWVEGAPGVPQVMVEAARRVFLDSQDQVRLDIRSA